MKIEEAIESFIRYLTSEKRRSPLTVQTYNIVLRDFQDFLSKAEIFSIEDIQVRDIREWQMQHSERGEAATTIAKRISTLRSWFSYLRRHQWYESDIMAKITTPKKPKRLPIFFKEKEVEQIYNDGFFPNDFEGERDKLMLRMLYETGVRRSELVGITEAGVDFSSHSIKVLGKRNKERIIPIEKELEQNILRYLALKHEMEHYDDVLLVDGKGEGITVSKVYTTVKKYMTQVSHADRVSPHIFRHTFATQMLNEGANIDAIKELLGHASLNSTEIYTHVTREHLKEAYRHAHPRADKGRKRQENQHSKKEEI